jgi:hypothetical protein
MLWQLEPTFTKNVVKFTTYIKGDYSFVHATYYRWGEAIVESDVKPEFGNYNEDDGLNATAYDCQLYDCYYSHITDLSKGVPKHISAILTSKLFVEEDEIRELEANGWRYCKHDIMFRGSLQVEKKGRLGCRD